MRTVKITYEIRNCQACPNCISKQTPTPDSFEEAYDYYCSLNNDKKIAGYVEHDWEMPEIPDWCPLIK